MSYHEAEEATAIKRKMASVHHGVTRISTKQDGLESSLSDLELASKLKEASRKLNLDEEYTTLHYELFILLIEEADDELESNEEKLAEHDDKHSILSLRIKRLVNQASSEPSVCSQDFAEEEN